MIDSIKLIETSTFKAIYDQKSFMVRLSLQVELLLQILAPTPPAKLTGRIFFQKLPIYLISHV